MENYISVKNTLGCQAPDFLGRGVWRLMCLTLPQVKGDKYLKMKTQRNNGQVRLYIYFFLTCRCRITNDLPLVTRCNILLWSNDQRPPKERVILHIQVDYTGPKYETTISSACHGSRGLH